MERGCKPTQRERRERERHEEEQERKENERKRGERHKKREDLLMDDRRCGRDKKRRREKGGEKATEATSFIFHY